MIAIIGTLSGLLTSARKGSIEVFYLSTFSTGMRQLDDYRGPEIPPSLRTRQKCSAINTLAKIGTRHAVQNIKPQ